MSLDDDGQTQEAMSEMGADADGEVSFEAFVSWFRKKPTKLALRCPDPPVVGEPWEEVLARLQSAGSPLVDPAASNTWRALEQPVEEPDEPGDTLPPTIAGFESVIGRTCILHSLRARPELNGASGEVLSWIPATGRFMLRVITGPHQDQLIQVNSRPANMRVNTREIRHLVDCAESTSDGELEAQLTGALAHTVAASLPELLGRLKARGDVQADVVGVMNDLAKKMTNTNAKFDIADSVRLECMRLQMPVILVALMNDHQSDKTIQCLAAHLLGVLARDAGSEDRIVAAGCLPPMARCIASFSPAESVQVMNDGVLVLESLNNIVFGQCAAGIARKEAAVAAGIIEAVAKALTMASMIPAAQHAMGQSLALPAACMVSLGVLALGDGGAQRVARMGEAGAVEAVARLQALAPGFPDAINLSKDRAGPSGRGQPDFLMVIAGYENLLERAVQAGMPRAFFASRAAHGNVLRQTATSAASVPRAPPATNTSR